MPERGTFVLYSSVRPPLHAGDYVLRGTQTVAGGPVEPYAGNVRITAPRYTMPPDQILSTFPPANAEGAFSSRLPQVVLRRRTLPWERDAGPGGTDATPWLALVVIAEGEGQLSGETPVGQCVTPGVALTGPGDVATSVYLAVSKTVVDAVFPTKDDLPLLAHVREVDINDTELIQGDDDGWLAVVLANRLPQEGKRYLACLVNLEGQLAALPVPKPPGQWIDDVFDADLVVQDLRGLSPVVDPDSYLMGNIAQVAQSVQAPRAGGSPRAALAAGAVQSGQVTAAATGAAKPASAKATVQGWQTTPQKIENLAVSASAEDAYRVVRDGMGIGFRVPVEAIVVEPTYRFPVLAHWSFTCTGAGDFQSLMMNLDVGLLGTLPAEPPAPPPGAPPAPPRARPLPEVAETGHVGLEHLTRRGDPAVAWFRGPLAPQLTERQQPGPDGRLPLAHVSDQIRRIVPDGREDLTYAAAFEIGRLLALAQPSVVAALLRWRAEQFGAERAYRVVGAIVEGLDLFAEVLKDRPAGPAIGPLLAKQILVAGGVSPSKVFGPSRPVADPGRPLTFLEGDLDAAVAHGLGLDLGALTEAARQVGVVGALAATAVPVTPVDPRTPVLEGPDVGHLRGALEATAAQLAADVTKRPPGIREAGAPAYDALDVLLGLTREAES
jgi:hypothetical protein